MVTNADMIRQMTDEELADLIVSLNNRCLAGIGKCDCSEEGEYCDKICMKKTKEWLKLEVK